MEIKGAMDENTDQIQRHLQFDRGGGVEASVNAATPLPYAHGGLIFIAPDAMPSPIGIETVIAEPHDCDGR